MNARNNSTLSAMAAINEPLRRALFELLSEAATPLSRDDAAAALEIPRSTAAFHLDRLVEEGVLAVEHKRRGERTGPGSGRPSKLYRLAAAEIALSIPERHYDLVGELLASAIERSNESGVPVLDALAAVAAETGREIGAEAGSLEVMLESTGFNPRPGEDGEILLANCPFHRLATKHTDVVCAANLALLNGVAEGAGDSEHTLVPDDGPPGCCVKAVPTAQARITEP